MAIDRDVFKKEARFRKLQAVFKARTDQNAQDINSYVDAKAVNTSPRRLIEYYGKLGIVEKLVPGKTFRDLTQKDILEIIDRLKAKTAEHDKPGHSRKIGTRSVNNYKDELKAFLKFLGKHNEAALIKKDRMEELNSLTSEDMLNEQEVEAVIRTAGTERNKAIIAVLSETGCRPSELFNLQIKDVKLNSDQKAIVLYGKKKKRNRPILGCVPYLTAWLNKHPQANNPEAPLFCKKDGTPMQYWGVAKIIKLSFARAGIKKPAILKIFRHTTNTFLYSKFPQEIAGKLQGHRPGSSMAKHYVHLSDEQATDAYSVLYGRKPAQETKPFLSPKICKVCDMENLPENTACERCKNLLTIKSVLELTSPNRLIEEAMEDGEIMKQLEERLTNKIMLQIEGRLRLSGKYGAAEI